MSAESTPCRSKTSCKRVLSSPEDESELKKKRLSEGLESASATATGAGLSDISDLSVMDNSKKGDFKIITGILADIFRTQIKEIVGPIVDGVPKGLNHTPETLQKENKELIKRVE